MPGIKERTGEKMCMRAEEVATVLDVTVPYAYKLIRRLNRELAGRGCFVNAGRIDRKYFYDQFYGTSGGAAHKTMANEEDIDNNQSVKKEDR